MIDKYKMKLEDNVFCAKRVLVDSVYKSANLEGIAVTFAETNDILNDVNVEKLKPSEISKVCCCVMVGNIFYKIFQNRLI